MYCFAVWLSPKPMSAAAAPTMLVADAANLHPLPGGLLHPNLGLADLYAWVHGGQQRSQRLP